MDFTLLSQALVYKGQTPGALLTTPTDEEVVKYRSSLAELLTSYTKVKQKEREKKKKLSHPSAD